MNAELQAIDAMFDRLFGVAAPTATQDRHALNRAAEAKRDAHIAAHTPQLARIYSAHPDHIVRAFGDVDLRGNPALLIALAGNDHCEIGKLLKNAMQPYFHQQAEDTAAEEVWTLYPDVPA